MKRLLILALAAVLLLPAAGCAKKSGDPIKAEIVLKDYGTITLELYPDMAPKTVENFCSLAESGFYDGLTIHRVVKGFVIQGGDPEGNGTGGSDKTIKGEFLANGVANTLSHTRGVISMARAKDYNSASSQFFIVQQDNQASLDGLYAAFGMVTDGMDIVDAICENTPVADSLGSVPPQFQPIIETITIYR